MTKILTCSILTSFFVQIITKEIVFPNPESTEPPAPLIRTVVSVEREGEEVVHPSEPAAVLVVSTQVHQEVGRV